MATKEEIQSLIKQIEAEQGNMSQYAARQAAALAEKVVLEGVLVETSEQLDTMQQAREDAALEKKRLDGENFAIKRDMEDLEIAIVKIEQENMNRDHIIRSLNNEITNQDEMINKLNKEKKNVVETHSKSSKDLQSAEEKLKYLNNVKTQLESTWDELEENSNREKRSRMDNEKKWKKLQGDLKVAQETVVDGERMKKELEGKIAEKEKEFENLESQLEYEKRLISKSQKAIKETQDRVEELEVDLETVRHARAKAERQTSELARERLKVESRINEAENATCAQIELNKKRGSEIQKLRQDLEEATIQRETMMTTLKRKHQDAITEMTEQIEQLTKIKTKKETDKATITNDMQYVRAATNEINKAKASLEKSNKNLTTQLNDVNKKVEEGNLSLADFEVAKRKMAAENSNLLRAIQDLENNVNMLTKCKNEFSNGLSEAKKVIDKEIEEKQVLLGRLKNVEHELDSNKAIFEEECWAMEDIFRKVDKATQEADFWRQKYETEALGKAEDLEMSKLKLQSRLSENECTVEQLNGNIRQMETTNCKLHSQVKETSAQCNQANILNASMEKKANQFDMIVSEWRGRVEGLSKDLDIAQKEARNESSELCRVKAAYEESVLQLDEVRKENKALTNEIKDLIDQISEGGRSVHEIDKIRKRLEFEKSELQAALEEAENAVEQEENKVIRVQLELTQVRQDIERRIIEKEDEFQSTRKNFGKAIENMQNALEQEEKAKTGALYMTRKLTADISGLQLSLDHAKSASMETQTIIKKYHKTIRDSQSKLEDEQRSKEVCRDQLIAADSRVHTLQNALEELRTQLEQVDRTRQVTETELADTSDQLLELTCQNQTIAGAKSKLETELQTLRVSKRRNLVMKHSFIKMCVVVQDKIAITL